MKFSIRDLFLMTAIVALVLGWVVDHQVTTRESLRLSVEVERLQKFEAAQNASNEVTAFAIRIFDEKYPEWRGELVKRFNNRTVPISQAPAPNPPNP